MSTSPGFFEFDASLPDFGDDKPSEIENYDICNDETFGRDLGDDEWDEDANADVIKEIEKERVPQKAECLELETEKQVFDDDDFDPSYITESIQQLILDDDEDEPLGSMVRPVPYDDPAIVSVPKSGPLGIKSDRQNISSARDLGTYGSPFKGSIWSAMPAELESRAKAPPPGLDIVPSALQHQRQQKRSISTVPPSQQQLPPQQMVSRGHHHPQLVSALGPGPPSPLEDPSVLTALPMTGVHPPPLRQPKPMVIVAQPKTLAELEQEMLAGDDTGGRQEVASSGVRYPPPPPGGLSGGRSPLFSGPPPMYMRFPAPPPAMPPGRGRGLLSNGPIPAQIRVDVPGVLKPQPVDGRLPPRRVGPNMGPPPVLAGHPGRGGHLGHGQGHGHGVMQARPANSPPLLLQQQPPLLPCPPPQSCVVDEYAGLMTLKEKQWLINIQLSQLCTRNPYIDDYYYTMYELKRSKKTSASVALNSAGVVDGEAAPAAPASTACERVVLSGLHQSANSGQHAYAPPVVENSLGKIQVGSAIAPRKVVDVATVASRSQQSVLLLIENIFTYLLELEDLRRQAGFLGDGDVKQTALGRLGRLMAIMNAICSLHDKAVLGAVLSVHKGRRLLERLVSFPALGAAVGPLVTEAALSNLSLAFPFPARGDWECLLAGLTAASCLALFRLDDVAALLKCVLHEPTLLAGVLAHQAGLSLLLAVLHRAAVVVDATRASSSSSSSSRSACEEVVSTSRALVRVLLTTNVTPLMAPDPAAAAVIAGVLDLPPATARDLESRFCRPSAAAAAAGGARRQGAQLAEARLPPPPPPALPQLLPLRSTPPPLIDFGSPAHTPTPPLALSSLSTSEVDRTPVLVPIKSAVAE